MVLTCQYKGSFSGLVGNMYTLSKHLYYMLKKRKYRNCKMRHVLHTFILIQNNGGWVFLSSLLYTMLPPVDPRKGRGRGRRACRPSFPITTAVVCLNMTEKEVNGEFSDLVPSPGPGSWASLSAARPPLCCSQRREVCAELLRGPCSGAASPASAGSPPPPWSVNHSVNQRQSMKAVPRQWAICSIVVDRRSLTGELSPSCARPTADDRVTTLWVHRPL